MAEQFTEDYARSELRRYHRKGPGPTTQRLLRGVAEASGGGTVIDAGAGFGALTFALLDRGFREATCVDLAPGMLAAGKEEAARRGCADRVRWIEGDFGAGIGGLGPADLVALDRVVCCYPEYAPLLERATSLSRRLVALAYPRERWYVRAVISVENAVRRLRGTAFRTFIHPVAAMEALLDERGFRLASRRTTLVWSADVWTRKGG